MIALPRQRSGSASLHGGRKAGEQPARPRRQRDVWAHGGPSAITECKSQLHAPCPAAHHHDPRQGAKRSETVDESADGADIDQAGIFT